MNIYELEKHSATGPFHTDDGYLYSGNGNVIAQTSGDGCGCDLDMLKHCRNHFMEALETLKALAAAQRHNQTHVPGSCVMICDAHDKLIAKLEDVK